MSKKTGLNFTIILCFFWGMILFAIQACKKNRSVTAQPESPRISADDKSPSWSPDGSRILFSTNRDGNPEIYIMDADGTNPTRLTNNPEFDGDPSWAPDGTQIAFVSTRDGNTEIYSMHSDGSDPTRLTDTPADEMRPSWSPDGTKIVFGTLRDNNWEVYVMNADSTDPTNLTNNKAVDSFPLRSPDGQKITFLSTRDGNPEIYTMDADGSNPTRLTNNTAFDGHPSWSPDGAQIAFASNRDGNSEIYSMRSDGSNQRRLTYNPASDVYPSWSPDGQKIAFRTNRDFDHEIYVMNADGSNPINMTKNAPANKAVGLAPLPQSELDLTKIPYKLVFESFRETEGMENWEICLIDADGSGFVNLTNTPTTDEMYPHVSPDGSLLCFEVVEGKDKESKSRNVYIMNIDGTNRVKIAGNANQPCWSADNKYIAYLPGEYPRFNPDMSANKGLEIYDLETSEVIRHPNEDIVHLFCLCWSPDGKWFTASSQGSNIAFMAEDKTMITLLASGCRPDISLNGKSLAWNGTDHSLNIGQFDIDSPQGNVTDNNVLVACERDYWVYHVDWSPDGSYLAFSYAPEDARYDVGQKAPGSNICMCDLRTGKWTLVTTDGKHNKEPDWVPVELH